MTTLGIVAIVAIGLAVGLVLIALLLFSVLLSLAGLAYFLAGAVRLFEWSAEVAGFYGIALYIIFWFIATPAMVSASSIIGLVMWRAAAREEKAENIRSKIPVKSQRAKYPDSSKYDEPSDFEKERGY